MNDGGFSRSRRPLEASRTAWSRHEKVGRDRMAQQFLISSGSVDITPRRPLMLGGFNKRTAPFTSVASRFEANVLLLRGESSSVTIVSTDSLYPGETLRAQLIKNLGLGN